MAVVVDVETPRPVQASLTDALAIVRTTTSVFDGTGYQTRLLTRSDIPVGLVIEGPAVITEPTATTVVPPSWEAVVEPSGVLVIAR